VSELEANQSITSSFLVHAKEVRQKKTGELYLSLLLGDRMAGVPGSVVVPVTAARRVPARSRSRRPAPRTP